jgi:hypothetical protein
MAEPHQGSVVLRNEFSAVHHWLQLNGQIDLITRRGIRFSASGTEAVRGLRKGEKVIRFYLGTRELGRAYGCCWGHRRNCSGKTIGTFCQPLDNVVI